MAQRATSLGPKPSLFINCCFCFCCFCSFPFFAFEWQKNPVFPLKWAFLFIFCVSLSLSLNLFWPSPFSVSLSLSLSCSCYFLSFFLVFLFLLSFGSFLFSLSHFSFFFAFVFWKEQHAIFKLQFIFSSIFSLFMVSCLVFLFQIPFSYLCFFPGIQLCFLFNINVFGFKKIQVKKHQFLVKRGVATKRVFFNNLCFEKCEKLFFCPFFGQILVDVFKNTV